MKRALKSVAGQNLRALAACAALVLALGTLSACSLGRDPNAPAGAAIPLTTWSPKATTSVDKVTWNDFEGEPQTLNPYLSADYTPNMINSNMCENLLAQTPDLQIKPNLAASYANPDPLHWVYNLRSDVTFWDGSPMTADDVAFSLKQNFTTKTTFYNYLYANVKRIDVTGSHQVTITLKSPDYLLNDELSSYAGVIVEKKYFLAHPNDFGTAAGGLMCTGPFEFQRWAQGQSITLTANPRYWNKAVQPKVHTLVFTFLTNEAAITAALLSGEIDGTYFVPSNAYAELQHGRVGTLYNGRAALSLALIYANPKGPMAYPAMRRALQTAIDWNGIKNAIFNGAGRLETLQTAPATWGSARSQIQALAKSLPAPASGQIAAAKKLLAGVPRSIRSRPITMVTTDSADTQQLGLAVKDAASRLGLNFTLRVVPQTGYSNYLYDPKTRAGVDILYTEFWPNIPNALDWLATTAVTYGSFNQSGYSGIDSMFYAAVANADPKSRAQQIVAMEKKLYNEAGPMSAGIELYNTTFMNKRITGAPTSFSYVYYPWAAYLGGTHK